MPILDGTIIAGYTVDRRVVFGQLKSFVSESTVAVG